MARHTARRRERPVAHRCGPPQRHGLRARLTLATRVAAGTRKIPEAG